MNLKSKKLFLLDMDGTIYLDNDLFEGTIDFLDYVKSMGGRYMFMTNNSSKSTERYIEKLASLGIDAAEEDFFTSAMATSRYLASKNYHKIYVLGTKSLKAELSCYPITDRLEDDIDCLVMGFDTELSFGKLEDACILLGRGVDYIATNPDLVCPTWYGSVPDCGSIAHILRTATGRYPEFIGKPKPEMPLLAMEKAGFGGGETVVIGDRIYTDVACGIHAGIDAILVLSGETRLEDVEKNEVKPTAIYRDIKAILDEMKA